MTFQSRSQPGFGVEFQGQSAEDDLYKLRENHGEKESGKQAILKTDKRRGDIQIEEYSIKTIVMWKIIKQKITDKQTRK